MAVTDIQADTITASTPVTRTTTFFDLPAALRTRIYDFIVILDRPLYPVMNGHGQPGDVLPIARRELVSETVRTMIDTRSRNINKST